MVAWLLPGMLLTVEFTQSIKVLYIPLHILKSTMFEKGDSSNKQKKMDAPFSSFYGKIWDGFCLNTGKRFS